MSGIERKPKGASKLNRKIEHPGTPEWKLLVLSLEKMVEDKKTVTAEFNEDIKKCQKALFDLAKKDPNIQDLPLADSKD